MGGACSAHGGGGGERRVARMGEGRGVYRVLGEGT